MKLSRLWVCGALCLHGPLFAGGGDDHSHGEVQSAPAAAATQALRVETASELFELVGSLEGDKLVMHLDRFASNEPVTGARITVEGGPLKPAAAVEREGVYTVSAAGLATPGTHALVFTVQAGGDADLLTGNLVVAAPAATASADGGLGLRWFSTANAAVALAAAVALGVGVFAWRRRRAPPKGELQ